MPGYLSGQIDSGTPGTSVSPGQALASLYDYLASLYGPDPANWPEELRERLFGYEHEDGYVAGASSQGWNQYAWVTDLYNSLYSNRPGTEGTPVDVRGLEEIGSGSGDAGPGVIESWKHGTDSQWLLDRVNWHNGEGSEGGSAAEESIPTNFDPGNVPFARIDDLVTAGLAQRFVNADNEIVVVNTPLGKLVFLRNTYPSSDWIGAINLPDDSYRLIDKVPSTYSSEATAETYFDQGLLKRQLLLTGGLTLALHLVPFGAAADQASQGDWKEAGISVAGDVAMFLVPVGKLAKLSPGKLKGLAIGAHGIEAGIGLYRAGEAIDILVDENGNPIEAAGPAGEALLRLVGVAPAAAKEIARLGKFRLTMPPPSLDETVDALNLTVVTKSKIGATGKIGEDALKLLGGDSQVFFRTSTGGRYIDQLVGGVAHKAKVGYATLDAEIKRQIAKDAELLQSKEVKGITWHFFTSPVTGLRGPSKPLLSALQAAGITVVIH